MEQSKTQELYQQGRAMRQNALTIDQLTQTVADMVLGSTAAKGAPIDLATDKGRAYLLDQINASYKLVFGDIDAAGKNAKKQQLDYVKACPDAVATNYRLN